MNLALVALLGGTLAVVGCSEDSEGGTGGTGGSAATPPACGGEPPREFEEGSQTAVGAVTCDGLGVIDVPLVVTLAAQPNGTQQNGAPGFDIQVDLTIEETTVGDLGALVQVAVIGETSGDVGDGTDSINVPEEPVPCSVDFTEDTDGNGSAGPIGIVTPVAKASFAITDGEVVLTLDDMTFNSIEPVPLDLSTRGTGGAGGAGGSDASCVWDDQPSLTFTDFGAGGGGGAGGNGGAGGSG